jgi:Mn-dependent DtxR family transcriptional regulator
MHLTRKFKDNAGDTMGRGRGNRLEFIRDAHNAQKIGRTTRMEDYLEVIYELSGISLTESGVAVAKNMHDRHGVLADFLKMIGVDEDTANRDAEGIEHHLHSETLKKLEEFIRLVKSQGIKGID